MAIRLLPLALASVAGLGGCAAVPQTVSGRPVAVTRQVAEGQPVAVRDERLAEVFTAAVPIAGVGASLGTTADVDRVRVETAQVAALARGATVTPAGCRPALLAVTRAASAEGAVAVGRYGSSEVQLHAFVDPQTARRAVEDFRRLVAACSRTAATVAGRRMSGTARALVLPAGRADAAAGARAEIGGGGGRRVQTWVVASTGNVFVAVHGGSSPTAVRRELAGLVDAILVVQQRARR